MSFLEVVFRLLGAIAALAFVLFLAWVVLRWAGKHTAGSSARSGRMIQILDRVSTGRNSSVLLLRVQDKVLVVAMSEHAIEKLCEIDDPGQEFKQPETPESVSFSVALKDAVSKMGLGTNNKPKGGGE